MPAATTTSPQLQSLAEPRARDPEQRICERPTPGLEVTLKERIAAAHARAIP